MNGEYTTELIRKFWIELSISKLSDIQKAIDGISMDTILNIAKGKSKLVDIFDSLELRDDCVDELFGIELSTDSIISQFKYEFEDLIHRILGYSLSFDHYLKNNEHDDFIYTFKLLDSTYFKLQKLRAEYVLLQDLTNSEDIDEKEFVSGFYVDNALDNIEDEIRYIKQSFSAPELSFKHLDITNELALGNNYMALNMMQLDKSNGIQFNLKHKMAQAAAEEKRGDNISVDNLETCVWNSGWLAPNGFFYGCSDLLHREFSPRLLQFLLKEGLVDNVSDNPDRCLELNNYIKFSCGRWLYIPRECRPSKEQLLAIKSWNEVKAKSGYVVMRDSEIINIDLLDSMIVGAKNYKTIE